MRHASTAFLSVIIFSGVLPAVPGMAMAAPGSSGSNAARAALLDQKGLDQLQHGRAGAAERSFQKALELDPDDPEAEHGLGRVAMYRHDYRTALPHLLRARELYAKRAARARAGRLETAAELDRHRQSASDQAASFADAGCLTERGVELWMSGSGAGDDADGPEGVNLRGSPPGLSFRIGTCQLHLGNPEAARTELERELRIAPGNGAAHLNLAVALLDLGEPELALEELDTAVRLGAREPPGLRDEILSAKAAPHDGQ